MSPYIKANASPEAHSRALSARLSPAVARPTSRGTCVTAEGLMSLLNLSAPSQSNVSLYSSLALSWTTTLLKKTLISCSRIINHVRRGRDSAVIQTSPAICLTTDRANRIKIGPETHKISIYISKSKTTTMSNRSASATSPIVWKQTRLSMKSTRAAISLFNRAVTTALTMSTLRCLSLSQRR